MIPIFQKINTADRVTNQIQDNLIRTLNPLSAQPINSGSLLTSVTLITGANSINHKLGRPLVGWFTTRVRAGTALFDTQDTNPTPNLTLNLVSSADSVVDLFVF